MSGERTTRTSWQGLFLRTVAMAHHFYVRATLAELEADALRTQRDAAVKDKAPGLAFAEAFAVTVEEAARAARRSKGGQHVPFHGDFCNVPPSALNRLEWWAREARAVLAAKPSLSYRAMVRAEMLRELAMERRAVLASGGVEVFNEALAEHLEAQAVEEEAAGGAQ